MAVVVRERRQIALDPLDRPGQEVEVLAGPERHLRPGQGGDLAAPQARAEGDGIAADAAAGGLDRGNPPAPGNDPGNRRVLEDPRARGSGALDQRRAEVRGADPPVLGRPDGADHVRRVHQRPALLGLAGADDLGAQAVEAGQSRLAANVRESVRGRRDGDRARVDPAGRLSGFLLEPAIERDRIADQLGEVAGRAQGADLRRGMPSRARGEPVALEQDGVAHALLGQVVERRAAHDAAADHDDGGLGGDVRLSSCRRSIGHGHADPLLGTPSPPYGRQACWNSAPMKSRREMMP